MVLAGRSQSASDVPERGAYSVSSGRDVTTLVAVPVSGKTEVGCMLERPRFVLFRRYFFPYSGEEMLTRAQSGRMIVSWALFFSVALTIATLPVLAVIGSSLTVPKMAQVLMLIWLGGILIFGLMA